MKRVQFIRQALIELGPLVVGLFLAVYLPITKQLVPAEIPLISALIFGNFIGRKGLGILGEILIKLSKEPEE